MRKHDVISAFIWHTNIDSDTFYVPVWSLDYLTVCTNIKIGAWYGEIIKIKEPDFGHNIFIVCHIYVIAFSIFTSPRVCVWTMPYFFRVRIHKRSQITATFLFVPIFAFLLAFNLMNSTCDTQYYLFWCILNGNSFFFFIACSSRACAYQHIAIVISTIRRILYECYRLVCFLLIFYTLFCVTISIRCSFISHCKRIHVYYNSSNELLAQPYK